MLARTQICKNALELEEKFSFPAAEMFRPEFEQTGAKLQCSWLKMAVFLQEIGC